MTSSLQRLLSLSLSLLQTKLDHIGCELSCSTMTDHTQDYKFVIARSEVNSHSHSPCLHAAFPFHRLSISTLQKEELRPLLLKVLPLRVVRYKFILCSTATVRPVYIVHLSERLRRNAEVAGSYPASSSFFSFFFLYFLFLTLLIIHNVP